MTRMIGYARAPTKDAVAEQSAKLKAAGCAEVFEDVAKDDLAPVPNRDRFFHALKPGDTMTLCTLDALSADRKNALLIVGLTIMDGTEIKVLGEDIDENLLREEARAVLMEEEDRLLGRFNPAIVPGSFGNA